jgi:hypothetical protein
MGHSAGEKLLALILAVFAAILAFPIIIAIRISTLLASIPSRVGERIRIESWIYKILRSTVDVELMQDFRDDVYAVIRPHLAFEEDLERWHIIREMEKDIQRINTSLVNGEYAIIVLISVSSIFIKRSVYGVPASVLLTIFALIFSLLIITRIVTMKILVFKPELYIEESPHDLAVRMAFNKGAFSRGASIGITIIAILIGISGGLGYEKGLNIVEWYAERSHPSKKSKWRAVEN